MCLSLWTHACGDLGKFPRWKLWCKEGDLGYISVGINGARFQIDGGDMRLLNDDEILAVVDDPEDIL